MIFRILGAALLVMLVLALVRLVVRMLAGPTPPPSVEGDGDTVNAQTCPYCGIYVAEPPEFIDDVCTICNKKRDRINK